jgi:hypothetical protein
MPILRGITRICSEQSARSRLNRRGKLGPQKNACSFKGLRVNLIWTLTLLAAHSSTLFPCLGLIFHINPLSRPRRPPTPYRARRQSAAGSQSRVSHFHVDACMPTILDSFHKSSNSYRTALHPFQSTGSHPNALPASLHTACFCHAESPRSTVCSSRAP